MSIGRNNIFHFPKERVSIGDTFRCRKCRTYLFSFENLTIFHKKIEPVDQCSSWYLSCDGGDGEDSLSWIKEAIDESNWTEGKLYCPKCSSRIGAFNITQGVKCSCFAFVIPAVWIQKCKVDQVTLVDSKPNIRLPPENPTEPDSYHGNNNQHGIQTSQTSSQTGQTSNSDTGKKANESHTIQTRQAGYTYDNQMDQTGFSTTSTASESFNSESEHFGSCTCLYTGQTSSKPATCNPEVDTKVHASSIQDSSQALQLTGFEQEPNLSSLQSEDPESTQIWPNVIRSYKAFDVNQTKSIHSCQLILTNQSLRRRQNPSQDFEVCSESNSNVYGRSKRTQRHTENGDICDEDYSVSHVESGSGEIQNQKKEEASEIPEHLICPICLDLLYEPLTSPCDHVFCDSCLRILNSKCRKSVPRCPLCRKSLNYVYPAVDLREEIRKTFSELYRKRHRAERRAPHRRLPLPSGRLKSRKKNTDKLQDVAMPYSVLVFLVCVLAVCVLCLVILFVFCPPSSNRCVTIIGYE